MPVPTAISSLSQTAASNSPPGTESPTSSDDYLRQYSAFIAMLRDGVGFTDPVQLASAATTSIGAQNSLFVEITGTTTITSFGSTYEGPRFLRFTGALILTHNATTLNLPGAANITTVAGDTAVAIPNQALNGWNVVQFQRADGKVLIGALTSGTAVASTSGTSVDFTSIPSWVKRISINYSDVSTSGTSPIIVQIGDSGGVEATGYVGSAAVLADSTAVSASNMSSGFLAAFGVSATTVMQGRVVLELVDSSTNTWTATISTGFSSVIAAVTGSGRKALTGTLDRVRLTTTNGTDTFDAGSVNVLYE